MKNANKDYYKRVYGKVNASDELKERLMQKYRNFNIKFLKFIKKLLIF